MRSLLAAAALLSIPLAGLALPTAAACPNGTISDDGTHSVTRTGFTITINGAGVALECYGFKAGVTEIIVIDPVVACNWTPIMDDGTHSVSHTGGVVTVNGVGSDWSCLGTYYAAPEVFSLP